MEEIYGTLKDGREVKIFTLSNQNGMVVKVTELGAILTSVVVPDREGRCQDLTHGYDELAGWEDNPPYFGSTVGRFGNRIANGQFTLDGKTYELATNNDPGGIPCHLHGGLSGFNKALWQGKAIPQGVELTYVSPCGEEGYPGELTVTVTYLLNDENELTWKAEATTTAPTPVNIIHHSYWNLSGDPSTTIEDHLLTLNAPFYLPTNPGLIPTGEVRPVDGSPMDFREQTAIGDRIEADFDALNYAAGYDHAWVLTEPGLQLAAKVTDPKSGRTLELYTDQPAVHFYAANFLDGTIAGKGGTPYARRTAFCLETESFPDGPNQGHFPKCILRPGETYLHTMVHKLRW